MRSRLNEKTNEWGQMAAVKGVDTKPFEGFGMDNSLHEYVMQSAQSAAKKTGSAVKSATQTGLPDWDSSSRKYELQTRRKRMMAGGVLVAIFGLFYVGRYAYNLWDEAHHAVRGHVIERSREVLKEASEHMGENKHMHDLLDNYAKEHELKEEERLAKKRATEEGRVPYAEMKRLEREEHAARRAKAFEERELQVKQLADERNAARAAAAEQHNLERARSDEKRREAKELLGQEAEEESAKMARMAMEKRTRKISERNGRLDRQKKMFEQENPEIMRRYDEHHGIGNHEEQGLESEDENHNSMHGIPMPPIVSNEPPASLHTDPFNSHPAAADEAHSMHTAPLAGGAVSTPVGGADDIPKPPHPPNDAADAAELEAESRRVQAAQAVERATAEAAAVNKAQAEAEAEAAAAVAAAAAAAQADKMAAEAAAAAAAAMGGKVAAAAKHQHLHWRTRCNHDHTTTDWHSQCQHRCHDASLLSPRPTMGDACYSGCEAGAHLARMTACEAPSRHEAEPLCSALDDASQPDPVECNETCGGYLNVPPKPKVYRGCIKMCRQTAGRVCKDRVTVHAFGEDDDSAPEGGNGEGL